MVFELTAQSFPKVALVGSFTPRQCGIATFTDHLRGGLAQYATREPVVVAMNDPGEEYTYGPEVFATIDQNDRASYRRAARLLNESDVDVVCIQHEYGIFGGVAGDYLLDFLEELRKPVTATLHTILKAPNDDQRRVLCALAKRANRLITMSQRGKQMLQDVYRVDPAKIQMIHHGVPDEVYEPRRQVAVRRGKTLMTFGLLSPDKGIENVIRAMPRILEHRPDARYMIVGATHPHVRAHSGEAYRDSLCDLAAELGVSDRVLFMNRFVSLRELLVFLRQTDIYITPYLKMEQITSGTLAYAVGCGRAIISTPYWHAEELLADDRGILVPTRDSDAIADAAIKLLTDDNARQAMEGRALELGITMSWHSVAGQYMEIFKSASEANGHAVVVHTTPAPSATPIAPVALDHLLALTDDVGLIQHALGPIPRYDEGYCVDDNARALLLMSWLESNETACPKIVRSLTSRYLAFIAHAFNPGEGKLRNFMSYSREWQEDIGSEDSQARGLWCLGVFAAHTRSTSHMEVALGLFQRASTHLTEIKSPRSWAYSILGLDAMLSVGLLTSGLREAGEVLAGRLDEAFQRVGNSDWPWCEDSLSYCNARLPQALLVSSTWDGNRARRTRALEALDWLWSEQVSAAGHFQPIGSFVPYERGGEKPLYDQQPVETYSMLSACLTAYDQTQEPIWKRRAELAYNWFLGGNHLGVSIGLPEIGACYDGLHVDGVNRNQGAESTLSFLLAQEELRARNTVSLTRNPVKEIVPSQV